MSPARTLTAPAGRWQDSARCATTDPDLFMPANVEQLRAALSVCARCVVIEECRAWADALNIPLGVMGGHFYGTHAPKEPRVDYGSRDDEWRDRHAAGWTDRQIADEYGVTRPAVVRWRGYRNLPANKVPRATCNAGHLLTPDNVSLQRNGVGKSRTRRCLTCQREATAEHNRARKEREALQGN